MLEDGWYGQGTMGFEYEKAFGTVVGVAVMNTITQFTTEGEGGLDRVRG